MNETTRNLRRSTRLVASAAGVALAALLALAPAAFAATPMELCPLEQGPDGVQCQKPGFDKPHFEMCPLEQGPNGLQCQKPPIDKPDFEMCDLEQGPDGPQCVGTDSEPEDPGPDVGPELQPQPEPEPEPEPEAETDPNTDSVPKGQPQANQPAATAGQAPAGALQVASEDAGTPVVQLPANPVAEPDDGLSAGWIALALVAAGAMFALGRRRRAAEESAPVDR
jgi:hypothetical protein